jgi:pyruvate/2-oxoglutarate dehydrogenase complex dihydrolipoamide dehydrogenase (E3) component
LSQGVALLLNQRVTLDQIERNGDAVRFHQPGGEAVEANLVLMATGRKANSGGMGLGALGIDDSSEWHEDKAHLGYILRPVSVWCGAHFFTRFGK